MNVSKWKFSSCCALLSVFLLCAFLPSQTQQFGIKKTDDVDIKSKKSYQFHKITKDIDVSEEDEDDDDDDDDDDEINGNDKEYFFEKVNKASIPIKRSSPLFSDAGKDDIQVEDDEVEESKDKLSGFFNFISGWMGSDDSNNTNDQSNPSENLKDSIDVTPETPKNVENDEKKDNGIINWLQSLRTTTDNKPIRPDEGSWIEYLDRWPINTIFPFGKIEKFVFPPKNGNPDGYFRTVEPISDEHFTNLLGSLPSFVVNPNHVSDIDCRQQLQILQRQLRGHKMWTMQMLDSSAKVPSGILRGNINQFGDFEMCTKIKTVVKVTQDVSVRIKGKYCLAHIEIQSSNDQLKYPVYLSHGKGLWNSHLGDPSHFAPRYSIVNWGICIPNLCPATIVRDTIDYNLRPYNHTGIHFHVEIDENDCYIKNNTNFKNLMKKHQNVGLTVGYLMLFISFVITGAIVENSKLLNVLIMKIITKLTKVEAAETTTATTTANENENENVEKEMKEIKLLGKSKAEIQNVEVVGAVEVEKETLENEKSLLKEIILSFSPKRSIAELFGLRKPDTKFAIFHLLKILCTFMLYVCLKYLMIGHLPILNRDKLVKTFDNSASILFRSPLIYLDILLIISGFLKSYQMCIEMEEKSNIHVLKRISGKILSYLPTLYAVLLFQTWILPYLGSGPLWSNLIGRNQKICEENMWRNLFGVQNVLNVEETCSPMTIQHSVELQLYLLTPLIVWLFYCNSDIGFMVYGGIHALSVAVRYSRTNLEHLSSTIFHGIHVSKFYRTANLLYASPIPRATPYLIGIGAAILHKNSGNEWKDMSKIGKLSGWLTAILSIIWCFWYPSNAVQSNFVYNSFEAASYASWSPLLLGLGFGWIVFMLPAIQNHNDHNDEITNKLPLHSLLTIRPILFLSRISYPMQLVSYVVVIYFAANVKEPNRYSITDLVDFGEIIIIILIATILSISIDIPIKKIQKIILDKLIPDRLPFVLDCDEKDFEQYDEHNYGDEEHGEEEQEYDVEHDTEITNDDEQIKDIWGCEPEIDDEKYFMKRNSPVMNLFNLKIENDDDESWRTESDIEPIGDTKDNENEVEIENGMAETEVAGETEEADDEDIEISEEDEVIHRPDTPERPLTPPLRPTFRRRRFNDN